MSCSCKQDIKIVSTITPEGCASQINKLIQEGYWRVGKLQVTMCSLPARYSYDSKYKIMYTQMMEFSEVCVECDC